MAIGFTALAAARSGEGITSFAMTEYTLPANRLGFIVVNQSGGGPPSNVPTISGWTQYGTYEHQDIRRVTVFTRVSGTDVTESPTIDFGGQTQSRVVYNAFHADANAVITGTAGQDAIVQAVFDGFIHSPSIDATPTLDALGAFAHADNASLSVICIGFNADTASPGTGFTQINAAGVTSFSDMGAIAQYKTTNDTVHELTGCTNSQDMFIGVAMEIAHVAVNPTITDQPDDATVADGATAGFSVSATGTGTLTYQWQRLPPLGGSWANVSGGSGGTSASYTTPTLARAADTGALYRCVVTDDNGSTNSASAQLTVTELVNTAGLVVGAAAAFVGEGYVGASDASGGPIANLAVTEAADTSSATVTAALVATLSANEAADTLSSATTAALIANLSVSEAADTLSSSVTGLAERIADAAITEDVDTAAGTATAALAAAATLVEAPDTLAATATASLQASATLTEAPYTISAAATVSLIATAAVSEAPDICVGTMTVDLVATAAVQETPDTLESAATAALVAAASIVEAADTLSAAVGTGAQIDASIHEGPDTCAATAMAALVASAAIVEADDTIASAATLELAALNANLEVIEASDAVGATAVATLNATASITEALDTLDGGAQVGLAADASLQEQADALSAHALHVLFADLDVIEALDLLQSTLLTVLPDPSDFYRFDIPGLSLRFDIPGLGWRFDVPGESLRFDVPSMPLNTTPQ
jgi:hypothetical protein